jgi:hypothetical protein
MRTPASALVSPLLLSVATLALTLVAAPRVARAARCSDGRAMAASSVVAASPHVVPRDDESDASDDCIPRNIYWMPGVTSSVFQPSGNLGTFYGGGVQFAPFQWSHNNDNFGPSQGTMILQASLLKSPRSTGTMALFELGATASFERNSSRRWLIPYFGGTVGALTQSELGTSSYMYPLLGGHLYWHQNLMIDAQGGYHFPFQDVDRMRGPRAELSMRISMW